jgi:predicted peroxiredoxin
MRFVYIGTAGSEDPTRAGLPLFLARGAREAGQEVEVILAGDAVVLFTPAVADNVQPVGFPAVKELLAFARENAIPVYG